MSYALLKIVSHQVRLSVFGVFSLVNVSQTTTISAIDIRKLRYASMSNSSAKENFILYAFVIFVFRYSTTPSFRIER